jgi:membrane fusion protein (multidrug efflux system)
MTAMDEKMRDGAQTDGGAGPAAARRKRLRKRLLIGVAGIVGLGALVYGGDRVLNAGKVSTDNAYVGADVAQVTPLVGGSVRAVHVSDTQEVKAGQLLVEIDETDARTALAQAQADLVAAQNRYGQTTATGSALAAQVAVRDADIDRARAQLASAQADFGKASIDLRRRRSLTGTGAVSGQELTDAAKALATAQAAVATARASWDQAVAQRRAAQGELAANRAVAGPNAGANPEIAAARSRVAQARLNLQRTRIRAPVPGIVAKRQVQVGQQVAAGAPVMTIVPVGNLYVDANFKEGQLGKVRAGQPVRLESDLYGGDVVFHGRVLGFAGGTGAAFALIPAQNATGNWIKVVQRLPVRIALDPAELRLHPLRVGLSMKVEVEVSDRH